MKQQNESSRPQNERNGKRLSLAAYLSREQSIFLHEQMAFEFFPSLASKTRTSPAHRLDALVVENKTMVGTKLVGDDAGGACIVVLRLCSICYVKLNRIQCVPSFRTLFYHFSLASDTARFTSTQAERALKVSE